MGRKPMIGLAAGVLGLVVLLGGLAATAAGDDDPVTVAAPGDAPVAVTATNSGGPTPAAPTAAPSTGNGTDDQPGGGTDRTSTGPDRAGLLSGTQAVEIARQSAPGSRVESVELEREHGRLVWSVKLVNDGTEHRVDVDAETGAVRRVRVSHD